MTEKYKVPQRPKPAPPEPPPSVNMFFWVEYFGNIIGGFISMFIRK